MLENYYPWNLPVRGLTRPENYPRLLSMVLRIVLVVIPPYQMEEQNPGEELLWIRTPWMMIIGGIDYLKKKRCLVSMHGSFINSQVLLLNTLKMIYQKTRRLMDLFIVLRSGGWQIQKQRIKKIYRLATTNKHYLERILIG